ncbi:hypothetical protein D7Z26_25655 [Cohnella endophytica]|uniref:Uncharacterized protein n=4 Tax=Paenibacillaceae TaxID=186822 RepID=A0A494X424_9BACL|nr:hypothetical protein D7Z26_25655 [Cohnella endophytica]TFE24140.1 hypothetical protein E2980_17100 [Cohnella luojiensis]BBI30650.1 hypothetical protein KCTCHS21_00490 [Cohnella abietis]
MYMNGQMIYDDRHFLDHMCSEVPVQIYCGRRHSDIGFIEYYGKEFVQVNNIFYNRKQFTFVSRPGY